MVEHELSMDELAAQEAIELPAREMMRKGGGNVVIAPTFNYAEVNQLAIAISEGGDATAVNAALVVQQGAFSEIAVGGGE